MKTELLFKPSSIKGLKLKNRIVRSATAEGMASNDGMPTDRLKRLYCDLSEGGVGLIITSGACIESWKHPPETLGFAPLLMIHHDRFIEPWKKIIGAVHDRGTPIAMQIGHLGRLDVQELRGKPPIAPSAVPIAESRVSPREMTLSDIDDIVEKFAQAGRRAKEAGFDAVQYHGAHGNLIHNFMSPYTNKRTDNYGGDTANRARFVTDIVKRTRQLVGTDYPLMIKMNFNDCFEGGLNCDDAVRIARTIEEGGIDCIEVSGGVLSESKDYISVSGINREEKEAYFRNEAGTLKKQVSIPVILVGGHRSPRYMAELIETGTADFVSLSRPFIREPGLVKRWKNGDHTRATCISCNQCFEGWVSEPLRCYIKSPPENSQS